MRQEFERPRFRRGESVNKPLGGYIADKPLPKTMYSLAVSRGYPSQNALSKALGKSSNEGVRIWYTGESVPTFKELGKLLTLINPNEMELETLVKSYLSVLDEKYSESFKRYVNWVKNPDTPIGQFIEEISKDKENTVSQCLACFLSFDRSRIRNDRLGLESLNHLRKVAPKILELSDKETISFSDSIDRTMRQNIESTRIPSAGVKRIQKNLNYRTYNSIEAGRELGVSRERVRQLRVDFNLPQLLAEGEMQKLRDILDRTKDWRAKYQKSRREKHQRSSVTEQIIFESVSSER